jgi:hypothetical protein
MSDTANPAVTGRPGSRHSMRSWPISYWARQQRRVPVMGLGYPQACMCLWVCVRARQPWDYQRGRAEPRGAVSVWVISMAGIPSPIGCGAGRTAPAAPR